MADAVVRMGYNDADLQKGLQRSAATMRGFTDGTKKSVVAAGAAMKTFGLGIFAAGGGVAGIKALGDEFDRIHDLSLQLNESPETLQRLGAMAKLNGSDVEAIAKAMNRLNREVADGSAAEAFRELGLDAARFMSLRADERLIVLAQAFQQAERGGRGLSAAYDLFGRSAAELLPLLRENEDALRKVQSMDVLGADKIAQIAAVNDELDTLAKKLKTEVASGLLDVAKGWKIVGAALRGMWTGEGAAPAMDKEIARQGQQMGDALAEARRRKGQTTAPAEDEAQVKGAAGEDDRRADAARELQEDMRLLSLRAAGQHRAAEALEKEITIRREAVKLAKELGITEEQAHALAKRRSELEDQAARGGARIRGYSRAQRDARGKEWGLDHEWRKPSALDDFRRLQTSVQLADGRVVRAHSAFGTGDSTSMNLMPRSTRDQRAALDGARRSSGKEMQRVEEILRSVAENTAPLKDY